MSYFAFINTDNVVTNVIVGVDEQEMIEGKSPEVWYQNFSGHKCIVTRMDGSIHKNFAAIGHTYDEVRDAFISPKPFPSWALNEETCKWAAPVPMPHKALWWDEPTLSWVLLVPATTE